MEMKLMEISYQRRSEVSVVKILREELNFTKVTYQMKKWSIKEGIDIY